MSGHCLDIKSAITVSKTFLQLWTKWRVEVIVVCCTIYCQPKFLQWQIKNALRSCFIYLFHHTIIISNLNDSATFRRTITWNVSTGSRRAADKPAETQGSEKGAGQGHVKVSAG